MNAFWWGVVALTQPRLKPVFGAPVSRPGKTGPQPNAFRTGRAPSNYGYNAPRAKNISIPVSVPTVNTMAAIS